MNDSLLKLRKEYSRAVLDEVHAHSEPIEQFRAWFGEAVEVKILEPNAMMLATVNDHGQPAARIVLIRDILTDRPIARLNNKVGLKFVPGSIGSREC